MVAASIMAPDEVRIIFAESDARKNDPLSYMVACVSDEPKSALRGEDADGREVEIVFFAADRSAASAGDLENEIKRMRMKIMEDSTFLILIKSI